MNRFLKGLSYTFRRNIGKTDRIIRTCIALFFLGLWYLEVVTGLAAVFIGIYAIMILVTAAFARCGITYWLDVNTMSEAEKRALDAKGIQYE